MPGDAAHDTDTCKAALAEAVSGVTLGRPATWRGLTVFPLLSRAEPMTSYMTLGPALEAGAFRITEVSDAGVVGELEAVNDGDVDVLLLDGEEVIRTGSST